MGHNLLPWQWVGVPYSPCIKEICCPETGYSLLRRKNLSAGCGSGQIFIAWLIVIHYLKGPIELI